LTVKDQNDDTVSGAVVDVQRYDLSTNAYTTREVVSTNTNGLAYFEGTLNDEFYKFVVEYPFGTQVLITSADYLRSSALTLRINTESPVFNDYFSYIDTYGSLSFNSVTNNFNFEWNGVSVTEGCLYVYEGDVLFNYTCVSASSGNPLITVVNSSGTTYYARGIVSIGGDDYLLGSLSHTFPTADALSSDNKKMFLLLTIFLTIVIGLLTLWNITVFLLLTPLPIFVTSLIGLVPISRPVGIGLFLVAITLAVLISKRS
jgi:hypothetical protein